MKLSTRNQIKGTVIEVKKGAVAAKVKIDMAAEIRSLPRSRSMP